MNTEEKAKAYEMALEAARKELGVDRKECEVVQQVLCNIFPELAESDNERIRKALYKVVSDIAGGWPFERHDITKKDALAYLEKQKEQKPLTTEETELNSIAFLEQIGYTCIPPGKEQNPAENHTLEFEKAKAKYEGIVEGKQTVLDNPEDYGLYKPAEWDEEDIKKIRSEEYTKGFNDAAFGGKLKKWNVEDEDRIRQIERIAQEAGCTQKLQEEIHDWLKSLRPSWTPSEEQMKALSKAIPVCMGVVGRDEVAPLESLCEQLKKL